MTAFTKSFENAERGASLLEILVAVSILGIIAPLASLHLIQQISTRKTKLDRTTAVALADGAVAQAAYAMRDSIRSALEAESESVRAQIFLDTVQRAEAGQTPGGAKLLTSKTKLALPPATTTRIDFYGKTLRRCQGKTPGRQSSPWLAPSVAYVCFFLDRTSDMPSGLWNSVDSAYPVLIELTMQPVDASGQPIEFDSLAVSAFSSQIRLFYSVVWVDKKVKNAVNTVQSMAKEQYVPIL